MIAIFTIIIVITRISGLRTFAKMSSFDFASTIAIGSILASVVMNTDQSLLKGGVALAGIVLFQTLFAFVALSAWAVGTSVGPLSGINLSLQGRYGVSGYQMMKNNLPYAGMMSLLSLGAIAGLSVWLG